MKSLYSEIIAAIHQRIANDKQLEQRAGKASAIVPARAKDAFWIDEGDVVFSESDCLGRGGFAAVYRARYQWNDVAVKVMFLDRFGPEKTRELLEGEIKVWLGLPYHENVLPLKGYRFEPNYLVSKLCSGGNLKIFLASKGWDARLRIRLLADAAAGVAFLHSRGVIHSDLKAENVVIDLQGGAEPVAMVADFGLAKARLALEETLGALGMSRYGGAGGGTPHYAPPEFFDPEGRLGRPSDVWSFAVMCFQVFNFGKPPFEEIHPERVGVRICTGGPPAPRPWGVPDTLWKLMEGCWNKNQGERPKMEDLVAELVRLRDCGESAPADSVPLTRSVIVDDDRAREETDRSGPQKKVRLGAA
ncbi:kinase-like domain-containing protein [Hyaloraphidium curvatum]|nr:kinase-like domain-containing protein [Hyaloraphidium curvatum]